MYFNLFFRYVRQVSPNNQRKRGIHFGYTRFITLLLRRITQFIVIYVRVCIKHGNSRQFCIYRHAIDCTLKANKKQSLGSTVSHINTCIYTSIHFFK